jgi:hypothetical protein
MGFVNLTPEPINIANIDGKITMTLHPSGDVAYVLNYNELVRCVIGIPIFHEKCLELINLPEPEDGVMYIVSKEVAQAAKRPDVLAPDTGPGAIYKDGQVLAVRGFLTFA